MIETTVMAHNVAKIPLDAASNACSKISSCQKSV